MRRAIDTCTCGRDRADHGNATDHQFMPNPQPNTTAKPVPFAERVFDVVSPLGSRSHKLENGIIGTRGGPIHYPRFRIILQNDECWEVQLHRIS